MTGLWFVVCGLTLFPVSVDGQLIGSSISQQPRTTNHEPQTTNYERTDSLLASFPTHGISMTSDHLNNIYLVTSENAIEKRDDTGKVLCTFSDKRYGPPTVDATDPMKVVAFYNDLDMVITLDNTLSPIGMINFQLQSDVRNPQVVGTASAGGLWLYDADDFRLKHVNETGAVTMSSDDLSLEQVIANPLSIIDRAGKIYVCDSTHGIHIFDSYLNYEKTIRAPGATYAEVIEQQLFYLTDSLLNKLDLQTFEASALQMPGAGEVLQISVQKETMFLLYEDRVEVTR